MSTRGTISETRSIGANMRPGYERHDQRFPSLLDATTEDLRSAMDAASIARAWAARLLATADLTRSQRQNLYDIARPHRVAAINRSPFGLLFDYAIHAPLHAATYGPALIEIEIVGRGKYPLPDEDEAHVLEEDANHAGNVAQLRRKERRARSTALDLVDAMNAQAIASKRLALATTQTR